jgi:alkanesulfonate monooxygenase SsuD/methylene tetrahydromethanopterin reductase-like flavin-dependent oxidoreductase (luciferase family)
MLVGAAVSKKTAGIVGSWADGLITVNQPIEKLHAVLSAFREAGGEGKPAYLQVHLSWANTDDEALDIAYEQWRSNVFGSELAWNLETPIQFDAAAQFVRRDDMYGPVLISSDPGWHFSRLEGLADLGFDALYLHHVGQEQESFIHALGERVIPKLT